GKREFVVQSDFAKHVDVLGYRDGKLSLLWQREIEMDFSNPQKILRAGPDPVADVDGDGRPEVLINLYNGDGDGRWHITVHDGITGAVKADLPDEYLDGLLDVDGDGTSELLTTRTTGGGAPAYGTLAVRRLQAGRARPLGQMDGLATDPGRNLRVRCSTKPDTPSKLAVTSGRARVLSSHPRGVTPGTAVVAQEGDRPMVIVQGAEEELVAFQPPRGDGAPVER